MFGTLQDTYVNVYELKWKEAQYKTTGDLTIYFCQTVIVKDSSLIFQSSCGFFLILDFVEKFITDTVRAAVDKYIMDTWKEV